MTTLLEQAIILIKAGDTEKAKQLLADVIRQNPRDENAWLWMTRCVGSEKEKQYCFGQVLKINPQNKHAIEGIKRLDSPVFPNSEPKTEPRKKSAQPQSVPQHKPKNSNSLILLLSAIGIIGFICVCGVIYSRLTGEKLTLPSPTASKINNASPQGTRPDYKSMLEANGFAYFQNDDDGDPIYISPCGCVVTVKPDYVGFAAKYYPDNECPIADMGAIIRIMYPSEVIDFVVSNMNEVVVKDTTVHGTAASYRINIDFDPYDPKLIMTIEDPR